MKFSTAITVASVAALAVAAPSRTVIKRADTCGQYDSIETGSYTIYNDLWGESAATSGQGCIGVDSVSGDTVAWHATWTWAGGSTSVKAFPNAVVSMTSQELSAISSMQSTWDWSYSGSGLVADVAYDMFTSSTSGGSSEYEIMVWMAAIGGAGPISSKYGSDGSATAIATTTIAGNSFSLYSGPNGDTTVYSFVPSSEITSFNGDIKDFFTYLINNEGLSSSQYLTSVGAGSEPTDGTNAVFTVSGYSITIS